MAKDILRIVKIWEAFRIPYNMLLLSWMYYLSRSLIQQPKAATFMVLIAILNAAYFIAHVIDITYYMTEQRSLPWRARISLFMLGTSAALIGVRGIFGDD